MSEEKNWKELSDDLTKISKKIKSNITDEENIEDLKNSLKETKKSILDNFIELSQIVENTIKDEEIKQDTLILINKLKDEMSNFVQITKERVSEVFDINKSIEEE